MKDLWIVITSINPPTIATNEFARLANQYGWHLLIVADTKTPLKEYPREFELLSIDDQHRLFPDISRLVPTKHYCRKNLGYLYAISKGAKWIFDTDDDNIPLDGFAESLRETNPARSLQANGFANVYHHFSDQNVWPRGLPLDKIRNYGTLGSDTLTVSPAIQQFLADKDPDVDAVFRLVFGEEVIFNRRSESVLLPPGTWCPFNSQATLFRREAFPLLFLPCHVSFRMTDIWRSFVAQRVLWQQGQGIVFNNANVVQERNPHSYMKDFTDEIDGYLTNDRIAEELSKPFDPAINDVTLLMRICYERLLTLGTVKEVEMTIVDHWLHLVKSV